MRDQMKPTGKTRYRSQRRWGGREELVLQIEVRGMHTEFIGGFPDSEVVTMWRDAKTTDLPIAGVPTDA